MAEPTKTLEAVIRGLRRGGQSGLADMVQAEIERLEPVPPDVRRPKRDQTEDRRQAEVADDVVASLIKAQIYERQQLQELMGEFGVERVETIVRPASEGRRAVVDVLTDGGRLNALRNFLETWHEEIAPLRYGETLK